MATLALGLVATQISIAPALTIGLGFAASFIDNAFIMPGIFGSDAPDVQGQRASDLSVQGAAEGTPTKFILGSQAKTAGAVIWSTDLVEKRTTESQGGGKGGGGGGTVTSFSYSISQAVHISDADDLVGKKASKLLKVWANGKLLFDADAASGDEDDTRYDEIRFYDGAQTTNDPLIDASLGADAVPYKGSVYMVIENLQLADFGNRAPNFEFLVEIAPSTTNAEGIEAFCRRAGLAASEFDSSGMSDSDLAGITIAGDQEPARGIEHIMLTSDAVPVEVNGVLVFFDRASQQPIPIDIEQFGAESFGGEASSVARPWSQEEVYDVKLPRQTTVTYDDPGCNWDRGARTAPKINENGQQSRTIDLPMTLTGDQASLIAQKALWSEWGVRSTVEGTLMPSAIWLNPGDVVGVTRGSRPEEIRMERVSRGRNYLIRLKGRIEEPDIFDQLTITAPRDCILPDDPLAGGGSIEKMLVTDHIMGVVGQSTNQDFDQNLVWLPWRDELGRQRESDEANLFRSNDQTSTGTFQGASLRSKGTPSKSEITQAGPTLQSRTGTILDDIPAAGLENGGFFWDRETEFRIRRTSDDWAPQTEPIESVIEGKNWAVVQGANGSPEVLAFRDVQDLGNDEFRVSHLLRGMRGTQRNAKIGHTDGDVIVPWADFVPGLGFPGDRAIRLNPRAATLGENWWKLQARGLDLSQITAFRQDITNGNEKPFPPYGGQAVRDGSGNLTILYNRSTRGFHGGLFAPPDFANSPLSGVDGVVFVLDILNPAGDTVVRSKSVFNFLGAQGPVPGTTFLPPRTGSINALWSAGFIPFQYPASEQTADGYSVGDPINCVCYHIGASSERGWASPVTVVG